MKPSMLLTPAVVPLTVFAITSAEGPRLVSQPSQPECAISTYRYRLEIACSLLIAYWTPCTYAPDEFASAHVGLDRLVTRLGKESGSTTATIRRFAYFGSLKILAMGSIYSVLYRLSPS